MFRWRLSVGSEINTMHMPDDEKAIEQLACNRRHREEVKRHDDLAMVLEKG